MGLPSSGKANCSFNASSSGESGAELMDDDELSLNDVEGIEDAGIEEVGSLYCRSGIRSLSLDSSTRSFKPLTPTLLFTKIVSGPLLLDLVAFGVVAPSGNTNGTTKPWDVEPLEDVRPLDGGRFGCLKTRSRLSCAEVSILLDRRFVALFDRGVVSWEGGALKATLAVSSLNLPTVVMLVNSTERDYPSH